MDTNKKTNQKLHIRDIVTWSVEHGCGEVARQASKKNRVASGKTGKLGYMCNDSIVVLDDSVIDRDTALEQLTELLESRRLYWYYPVADGTEHAERLSPLTTLVEVEK